MFSPLYMERQGCVAAMVGRQFIEHVAGDSAGAVGAELGQLLADLDLGPKSKVAAHEQLYKFHLGAIRLAVK